MRRAIYLTQHRMIYISYRERQLLTFPCLTWEILMPHRNFLKINSLWKSARARHFQLGAPVGAPNVPKWRALAYAPIPSFYQGPVSPHAFHSKFPTQEIRRSKFTNNTSWATKFSEVVAQKNGSPCAFVSHFFFRKI